MHVLELYGPFVHPHSLRRQSPGAHGAAEPARSRSNGLSPGVLPAPSLLWVKPICHILVGTQDGWGGGGGSNGGENGDNWTWTTIKKKENYILKMDFFKDILLPSFGWQGLIFQTESVFLTHLQGCFSETNPNEQLRFKLLVVTHTGDIQGTFLKPPFWDRLLNMSVWIKFFIAVVSELKNCISRRPSLCRVS